MASVGAFLVLSVLVSSPAPQDLLVMVRTPDELGFSRTVEEALAPELAHRPFLRKMALADRASVEDRVFGCGGDIDCVRRALRDNDAELCLRVLIDLRLEPAIYSLELISQSAGLLGEDGGMRGSTEPWERIIRQAADRLLSSHGHPYLSRIEVRTEPDEAHVEIEPSNRLARLPEGLFAPPGLYEVTATLDGYQTKKTNLSVLRDQDARVDLDLVEDDAGLDWSAVAIGAGIVGAAVLAGALVSSATAENRPCICLSSMGAVCGECPP